MSQNPFTAPEAALDRGPDDVAQKVGRFWGWMFAAPVIVVLVASLVVTMRYAVAWNVRGFRDGLLFDVLMAAFVGLPVWSGAWWSRRFGLRRWFVLLGFALTVGAVGAILFIGGMTGIVGLTGPQYLVSPTRSDAIASLECWLGMSVYVLIQGLFVHWSLWRRARKQVT